MKELVVAISLACVAVALTCGSALASAQGAQRRSEARQGSRIELCQQGTLDQQQSDLEQPDQRQQDLERPNSQRLDGQGDDQGQYNLEQPDQQQQDLERPRYDYD